MKIAITAALLAFVLAARSPAAEQVKIDLNQLGAALEHRASGFLHSMTRTSPPDELIAPLKPRLFRTRPDSPDGGVFNLYNRVTRMGAAVQIVVSDGYSNYTTFPGDGGDWSRWETHVSNLVKRAASEGKMLQWDIWNEPDGNYFWKPSIEQYFETWRRGVAIIRKLNPRAVIVGPSLSNPKSKRLSLEQFLVYAKEHNCLPDVLSWHQWNPNVTASADEFKKMMTDHGINITRISLNEMVTGKEFSHPGVLPRYFAEIGRAGVETAAHACWNEGNGVANCDNASLDGLLTSDTHQPRSVWHVYAAYGRMNGKVATVTPSASIDGLSVADKDRIRMLVGRFTASEEPVELSITGVKLPARGGKLHVRAQRIPDSGLEALKAPVTEINEDRPVAENGFQIALPRFGTSDAYVVTITAQ